MWHKNPHKNVFKFFKFSGTNLGWGGGDKPWSKNGDKCRMGGLTKFLLDGGDPPFPQEKKNLYTNKKKTTSVCLSLSGYTFRHSLTSHADILDIDYT